MSILRSATFDPYETRAWQFEGYEVIRATIDYQFTFDCARFEPPQGHLMVMVGLPFTLSCPEGERTLDPEDRSMIGGALLILHRRLVSITASASGRLIAQFDGGVQIIVEKHEQLEAWQALGDGEAADMQMLCSAHDVAPWGNQTPGRKRGQGS